VVEAETCCHLVTLNNINIHNTSFVLTCEYLLLISIQLSAETLLILRRIQLDISAHKPLCTVHIFWSDLHEVSRQILETYSNIKLHENPFGGSRVIPHGDGKTKGRTDRHD